MLFISDYYSMKLVIILDHTFYGVKKMQVYKKDLFGKYKR